MCYFDAKKIWGIGGGRRGRRGLLQQNVQDVKLDVTEAFTDG